MAERREEKLGDSSERLAGGWDGAESASVSVGSSFTLQMCTYVESREGERERSQMFLSWHIFAFSLCLKNKKAEIETWNTAPLLFFKLENYFEQSACMALGLMCFRYLHLCASSNNTKTISLNNTWTIPLKVSKTTDYVLKDINRTTYSVRFLLETARCDTKIDFDLPICPQLLLKASSPYSPLWWMEHVWRNRPTDPNKLHWACALCVDVGLTGTDSPIPALLVSK